MTSTHNSDHSRRMGSLVVFGLFSAAYVMSYFYRSANAVIAPDLSREMSLGAAQLGLMTSLFYAAFASVQIPLGVVLDRFGARWVTSSLMFVGAGGSLLFAGATTFSGLAIGRAFIGVGMAGILMGSLKIFSVWFSAERFSTVSGLLIGVGSLGALLAATPMAVMNNQYGWRSIFLVGAILTSIIAIAIMVFTRNTPPGVKWTTGSSTQGSIREVFVDWRFWRIAPMTLFLTGLSLGYWGLWAGPYLYDTLGMSDVAVGNTLLLLGVGSTIGFLSSGWISDRFGLARVIAISSVGFTICLYLLALTPNSWLVRLVYFAFGYTGAYNVMLLAQARHIFPLYMTGVAVTSVNFFAIGGTFVLQWAMGLIIGLFQANEMGQYPPQAYSVTLAIMATCMLLSLLWYLPLVRFERRPIVAK